MAGALALAISFLSYAEIAAAQSQQGQVQLALPEKPDPKRVSGPEISMMIRSVMVAVHQANTTGNYTVLRDLGARSFRDINSSVRLGALFTNLRDSGFNIGQTVLFDPRLMKNPVIDKNGLLLLEGFFPTKPYNVVFKLAFRFEDKDWRLFSIAVGVQPPDKISELFSTDATKKKPASAEKKAEPAAKKTQPTKKKKSQSATQ
ncbi:MAG: hypothetical protein AB7F76_01060 [Parvibaculaceae bacterium]